LKSIVVGLLAVVVLLVTASASLGAVRITKIYYNSPGQLPLRSALSVSGGI
jgi:hypothetical protein